MRCTNCGKPLEPGDEFCVHCGSPVAPRAPGQARVSPQQPQARAGGFFSSPGGITLIVVLALLVVGGAVTGIVLGTRGGGDKEVQVEEMEEEDLEETTRPKTTTEQSTQPSTQPAPQPQPQPEPQPASNQTPEACQAAMLEFARQSAASYEGPPIDPNSVRIEGLQMTSSTHGVASAFGADQYGETLMGAVHADYRNGSWVCRWEQN